ncbi:hypothetical protein ACLMJK_001614 [Lecanora helva]
MIRPSLSSLVAAGPPRSRFARVATKASTQSASKVGKSRKNGRSKNSSRRVVTMQPGLGQSSDGMIMNPEPSHPHYSRLITKGIRGIKSSRASATTQGLGIPATPFPFMKLPPEVNEEAKGLIYDYGVLRINETFNTVLGVYKDLPFSLTVEQIDQIQNFQFDVVFTSRQLNWEIVWVTIRVWEQFWMENSISKRKRKTCTINVRINCKSGCWDMFHKSRKLYWLSNVENLFLNILDRDMRDVPMKEWRKKQRQPPVSGQNMATSGSFTRASNRNSYKFAEQALMPLYGPAIWNDHQSKRRRYLEFHPLEYPMNRTDLSEEDSDEW